VPYGHFGELINLLAKPGGRMSTPSIGLSKAELQFITGYKYPKAQISALVLMEIPFKVRPDGTPLVFRSATHPETTPTAQAAPWKVRM
jgi:hypothetical protein